MPIVIFCFDENDSVMFLCFSNLCVFLSTRRELSLVNMILSHKIYEALHQIVYFVTFAFKSAYS